MPCKCWRARSSASSCRTESLLMTRCRGWRALCQRSERSCPLEGQQISPATFMLFGEIGERALGHDECLELLEDLAPRRRHESVPNSGHIDQFLSSVVADDD